MLNNFEIILRKNILLHLRILNLFINYVGPFVDIALTLTFFDSSFNSFLFDVKFFSSLSKVTITVLLANFACFSLAVKVSDVTLLNF